MRTFPTFKAQVCPALILQLSNSMTFLGVFDCGTDRALIPPLSLAIVRLHVAPIRRAKSFATSVSPLHLPTAPAEYTRPPIEDLLSVPLCAFRVCRLWRLPGPKKRSMRLIAPYLNGPQ